MLVGNVRTFDLRDVICFVTREFLVGLPLVPSGYKSTIKRDPPTMFGTSSLGGKARKSEHKRLLCARSIHVGWTTLVR